MGGMQMITDTDSIASPVSGMRLEKNLSRYIVSVRVGAYLKFDYATLSNQQHYHDCFEFVLVLQGRGTFQCADESHVLHAGDLFVSDPGMLHEIRVNANEELTLLYFFVHLHEKAAFGPMSTHEEIIAGFLKEHHAVSRNQKHLIAYMHFFQDRTGDAAGKYWLTRALENFIFECMESAAAKGSFGSAQNCLYGDMFERILDHIDQNLDKKLTADDIAKHACTSRRNLYYIFRQKLNRTVSDYVNQRKMLLAEHYLNMNISVTETARLVGIESLSYFNRLFKKYKDVPPSEYRKKCMMGSMSYGRRLLS